MSTRLTQKGTPMIDSQALRLVLGAARVQEITSSYLSKSLKKMGYEMTTPSVLNFLSTLECGVNYGSEIARNLGVSRQMVAKTVKALCLSGYLEQLDGVGKQKQICFTAMGEQMMSDARQLLADIDVTLMDQLGPDAIDVTVTNLNEIQQLISQLDHEQ